MVSCTLRDVQHTCFQISFYLFLFVHIQPVLGLELHNCGCSHKHISFGILLRDFLKFDCRTVFLGLILILIHSRLFSLQMANIVSSLRMTPPSG